MDDVSINVNKGEILVYLDPMERQKYNTKNSNGIYEPDTGNILINSSNVTKHQYMKEQ